MLKEDIVTTLTFAQEKPFWKMDTHEKLEASERKKLDGNVLFKAGKFWRASKKYEKASPKAMKLRKIHHPFKILLSFSAFKLQNFLNYKFQAAKYIEFDHSFTDEEMCLAKSLRLSCYLNNAACKLKSGEFLEASRLCTKVYFPQIT
jgi:FK506-binding protein 4/5